MICDLMQYSNYKEVTKMEKNKENNKLNEKDLEWVTGGYDPVALVEDKEGNNENTLRTPLPIPQDTSVII